MKDKYVLAPKIIPHKYTPEEFTERYNKLCQETGFVITFEPRWIQSKDIGDYRLVIATGVIPIPKQENSNGSS